MPNLIVQRYKNTMDLTLTLFVGRKSGGTIALTGNYSLLECESPIPGYNSGSGPKRLTSPIPPAGKSKGGVPPPPSHGSRAHGIPLKRFVVWTSVSDIVFLNCC